MEIENFQIRKRKQKPAFFILFVVIFLLIHTNIAFGKEL